MRVCVICVYVCLLGDTCNIDGFYFRTMECSKNILFTLLLLIHGHTHECSLYIHSLQRKLLFLLRVHPMGSSSVLIQYLNFLFLRSRKRLRCTLGSVRGCGGAGSSWDSCCSRKEARLAWPRRPRGHLTEPGAGSGRTGQDHSRADAQNGTTGRRHSPGWRVLCSQLLQTQPRSVDSFLPRD